MNYHIRYLYRWMLILMLHYLTDCILMLIWAYRYHSLQCPKSLVNFICIQGQVGRIQGAWAPPPPFPLLGTRKLLKSVLVEPKCYKCYKEEEKMCTYMHASELMPFYYLAFRVGWGKMPRWGKTPTLSYLA